MSANNQGSDEQVPGDHAVVDVYQTLRRLAQRLLSGERSGHTLQATALVHEAYLRLGGDQSLRWNNRSHFFHCAAEAMRRILIEHARARKRLKRGGAQARRLPASVLEWLPTAEEEDVLALEDAIKLLEERNPTVAEVVRLRFYAGLSVDETAAALGRSPRSVDRDWAYARAWLHCELYPDDAAHATPPRAGPMDDEHRAK